MKLAAALACTLAVGGAGCTRPDASPSATAAAADAGSSSDTAAATAPASRPEISAPSPASAVLRERGTLTFAGISESWRLEWTRPPFPACRGAAGKTCVCTGFAPGERGDLDLVRERPRTPAERLPLSPLFEDHEARLPTSAAAAGAHVLAFADYDHDGNASELAFQVGAGPCGHTSWAVIGVSRANPTLHAFSSAEDPKTPLVLDQRSDWETLRAKGSLSRVQVACGDHGADESTSVTVTAKDGVLHSATRTAACPP